jgi:hypothetical protein
VTRLAVTLGEVLAVCAIWLPYYMTRRLRGTLVADSLVDDELP